MNIAILLGVSEYNNTNNLPACKKDLEIMEKMIKATGKYDNVIYIPENTEASNVKEKITNKISDLKHKEIEEIFFYYTGHGDFYKNEFYYVLSDFDKEKRKKTSLENLEVDNWFRSLNPKMTIKVVDACNAGVVYVKEDDNKLEKYLNRSRGSFNKCYFMFSSNVDQSSYQDENLSFFTKSFINAVKSHNAKDIRYKDIIDYVSDDFGKIKTNQTPFFVTQADYTEKFCSINPDVKNLFSSNEEKDEEEKSKPQMEIKTLASVIKSDAKSYLTGEEVDDLLNEIKEKTENHEYSNEFISIYDMKYTFDEIPELPKENVIGKWLDENDNEYFIEIESNEVPYSKKVPILDDKGVETNQYKMITKYRKDISRIYSSVDLPYSCIEIIAKPKYPNIPCYKCIIPFVFSKTEMRFFYCFATYKDINWNERELIKEDIQWITSVAKFENIENVFNEVSNIQNRFCEFIINYLEDKFMTALESKDTEE
jgi:hypothetical protein